MRRQSAFGHLSRSGKQHPRENSKGDFLTPYTWSHCPAAMQIFLEDVLDVLDDLGLKVPSQGLPPRRFGISEG